MAEHAQAFITYLQAGSLAGLQTIPKSDLHSHAGRGGRRCYIARWADASIAPPGKPFASLQDMQEWFEQHIKVHCPGMEGYLKRIEAAFAQAQEDGIRRLALSFSPDEVHALGGMARFTQTIGRLQAAYAPNTIFLPELSLDRACDTERMLAVVEELLSYNWFVSLDICCNELAQPAIRFQPIYRLAQKAGLRLKVHAGEFGTADDVWEACETLQLHEVHHGIAAATSKQVMQWLAKHKIRLNICPTSNVLLGRVASYKTHPIRMLYDQGIPVTVNTDDLLIFDQSVSQEYQNLYQCGLMSAPELNAIRETGLST